MFESWIEAFAAVLTPATSATRPQRASSAVFQRKYVRPRFLGTSRVNFSADDDIYVDIEQPPAFEIWSRLYNGTLETGVLVERKDKYQNFQIFIWRMPSVLSNVRELLPYTNLLKTYTLHPIDGFSTALPQLNYINMFGGVSFKASQIPNLAGKNILVTGGNTGLGYETILQLSARNPSRIYLAARSQEKANTAISSLKQSLPAGSSTKITHLPLDLASLPSVHAAARTVLSESSRLDLLILNAGIMAVPPTPAATGHEPHMATNHLGHFLLTRLLLPLLLKTASTQRDSSVRVVTLSSEAWNLGPSFSTIIDTPALLKTGPWTRYGASKAANIMFAAELARRYGEKGITAVSLHPGLITTDLYGQSKEDNFIVRWGTKLLGPLIMQDVKTGALGQLWASTCEQDDLQNGKYYTPIGKLGKGNGSWGEKPEECKELWEWTEKELEQCDKEWDTKALA